MTTRYSRSVDTGRSRGTARNRSNACSLRTTSECDRTRPTLRPTLRPKARFGRTDGPRTVALSASPDPEAGLNIKLVNLVKTADDLVPFGGRDSPRMGMLVWEALQRETDDPRTLLSLGDADIERLWRLADGEQRDHGTTVDYRVWDDLPSTRAGRATVQFRARTTGSTIGHRYQRYTLSSDVESRERDGGDGGDGEITGCVDDPVRRALAVLSRSFPFLPKIRPRRFKALVGTAMAGAGTCDMVFEYQYESPTDSVDRQSVDTSRQFVRVVGPKVFVAMDPGAGRFTLLVRIH